jgi:hypothetical protein
MLWRVKGVFLFVGAYATPADAQPDYEIVKQLQLDGAISAYDAAVLSCDDDGLVEPWHSFAAGRQAGWTGTAVAAVVHALAHDWTLPADPEAAGSHQLADAMHDGLAAGDLRELEALFRAIDACLIVVAESPTSDLVQHAGRRAWTTTEKVVYVDWSSLGGIGHASTAV